MRVVHVDTATEWRGGQTQLLQLLRGRPGDSVVVAERAPLLEALVREGIPHRTVRFSGPLLGARSLAQVLTTLQPDLVAVHTSHAHSQYLLSRYAAPLVVHRRLDFRHSSNPLRRWKYQRADGYVAVSHAVARVLMAQGVSSSVISVVHDGVDADPIIAAPPFTGLRRTLELADDLQIVIAVGALVEHKGHSRLVEAMQALPNHALILVGEGELRADLERQVVAAGLESRVKLLGQRADVYSLMKAADLFCHPSREEGMGQAVVEAMLAGLPVVATAVGGVPEVLRDDGVLVETGLPSDIARGISGASVLAAGPVLQRAAMRVRREYSVLQMTQGTEAAYRLILGS